jgi:hypothetical protein
MTKDYIYQKDITHIICTVIYHLNTQIDKAILNDLNREVDYNKVKVRDLNIPL